MDSRVGTLNREIGDSMSGRWANEEPEAKPRAGISSLGELIVAKRNGTRVDVHRNQFYIQALQLNQMGWRTFPVNANRNPLVRGYQGIRPYPKRALERMPWDACRGLGIAEKQGVISLDVDCKPGREHGYLHLETLIQVFGPLPPTYRFESPKGGVHLRYTLPRDIPQEMLMRKLPLPDGSLSHIDLINWGFLYHNVWQVDDWLTQTEDPPVLPESWLQAITRQERVVPTSRSTETPSESLGDLVEAVDTASEGSRNDTLNRCYFLACCQGRTSLREREEFSVAAHRAGLDDDEIRRTLDSAYSAAFKRWLPVQRWLDAVDARHGTTSPRANWVLAAADEMALLHMSFLPGVWLDMSSRRLAELLGCHRATAASSLSKLVTTGFLASRGSKQWSHSKSYQLNLNDQVLDIYPLPPKEGHMSTNQSFGVRHRPGYEARKLSSHPAFWRTAGGPSLTRVCAPILLELRNGPATKAELSRSLECSRSTVVEAVRRLSSAGLVTDGGRQPVSLAVEGSLWEALDEWLSRMGLADRPDLVRQRFEMEREAFRLYVDYLNGDVPYGSVGDE